MPKAGGIAPRKKRTNIFKQLASAGLIPSTILIEPNGETKISFTSSEENSALETPLEAWRKKRDAG
jgi:hypothetical protein